jgi:hypothetical protein
MKIVSITRDALILKPTQRNDESGRAFIFDIGIVPDKPTPKRIIIQKSRGRYLYSWSMTWRKFLRQTCIGHIALIDKSEFSYEAKPLKRSRAHV